VKPAPDGWPRISSSLHYLDGAAAIDWLCRAFGFEVRIKVEGAGGRIEHSELVYGDGLIMVSDVGRAAAQSGWRTSLASPRSLGGANTQTIMLYVDDVDAHCAQARAAGAQIYEEPAVHDYGEDYWADRSYGAIDLEGHHWWFSERIRSPKT
jgi:uncharacterized glyoxalase superfamily protein PhnB